MHKGTKIVGRGPQFDSFSDIVKIDWKSLIYISERIPTTVNHLLSATFEAFVFTTRKKIVYTSAHQFFTRKRTIRTYERVEWIGDKVNRRSDVSARRNGPHTNI